MKFLETRDLRVSTLSPVHVGCGEDYEPTRYVMDTDATTGVLHVLDVQDMVRAGGATLAKDVARALENGAPVDQLRGVQDALQRQRKVLADAALAHVPVCRGVLAQYRQTQNKHEDFNKNGIERTAYSPVDQLPYLPGSSLKGALRTAWLRMRGKNEQPPVDENLQKRIDGFNGMIEEVSLASGATTWKLRHGIDQQEYKRARREIDKDLGKAATNLEREWLGGGFQTDPLRALKIGDARSLDAGLEREIRFCLNRSRSGHATQAQSKRLYTRLEYIGEHQPAVFDLAITLQDLVSVAGREGNGKPMVPESRHLVRWDELANACNDYYLPRLDRELNILRTIMPASAWAGRTEAILDAGLREDICQGICLLLRVGKHVGADSNTVDGRWIKIMLNEDKKFRLHVYDTEPRTTWFCGDDLDAPTDLLPHGWIVLSPPQQPWMESMPGHQRRVNRQRDREEEVRRRAEAEAGVRKAAEARAAREAALAAMSENRRRIEALVDEFRTHWERHPNARQNPNAVFHGKARELAKAALDELGWTPEEKNALADAIEAWLPKVVKVDIKDERKKLRLNILRGT